MCEPDRNVKGYIEAGQIRPLIVFSPKRVPQMVGVPTAIELGHKAVLDEWRAIAVKAGTDASKIQLLSDAISQVYKSPGFQQFLKSTWSDENSYVSAKDLPAFLQSKQQEIRTLIEASH